MYSKAGKIGLILLGMMSSFVYGSASSSNQWVARKPSSYQAPPQNLSPSSAYQNSPQVLPPQKETVVTPAPLSFSSSPQSNKPRINRQAGDFTSAVQSMPGIYQGPAAPSPAASPTSAPAPSQPIVSSQISPVTSTIRLPNPQAYAPYNQRVQPQTEVGTSLQWGTKKKDDVKDLIGAQKTLEKVLQNDASGIDQRRFKASEGRAKQALGKEIADAVQQYADLFEDAASIVPEFHLTVAGEAAIGILGAIKWGGKAVGMALAAIGRYQETSQKILSVNEQIVEVAQQSFENICSLTEALNEKVEYITLPKLIKEEERAGAPLGRGKKVKLALALDTWKNTVTEVLDKTYFTDFKSKRGQEIKLLREQLMAEKNTFEDYIRLLQIRILEETIKNIEKLFNFNDETIIAQGEKEREIKLIGGPEICKTFISQGKKCKTIKEITFEKLAQDIAFFQTISSDLRVEISKNPSKKEKLREALTASEEKLQLLKKEYEFYKNFDLNPQNRQELEGHLKTLKSARDKLYQLTRLFKEREAVDPLEKIKFTLEEKENNKKEIESLKKQMENLQVEVNSLKDNLEMIKNKDFEEITLEFKNKEETEGS